MSMVIAFEGSDGSGKTTLIELTAAILRAKGVEQQVVGKSDGAETRLITQLIQSPDLSYTTATEALLKLAREHQRFAYADRSPVTLLDRGLVSIASVLNAQNIDLEPYRSQFNACLAEVEDYATVYCDISFDRSWERMTRRARETGAPLSKKELRGPEFNRDVHRSIERLCVESTISGPVYRVDTWSKSPEDSASEVATWICQRLSETP
ncbi:dTMP kinase [Glycomyces buryatensis]|uniref:Thymidylate kinase-like domain-containing protein n=1 Tax=Glycomyces buryatensis TaxID=2570927 RepID=A0A4S8QEZ1_9ACTN|nr:deoxynucleoside kinase [Glycomyces buryatensis]THV41485.1 hypothetical protein FAB82_11200 [Glycomyces buryatensis]